MQHWPRIDGATKNFIKGEHRNNCRLLQDFLTLTVHSLIAMARSNNWHNFKFAIYNTVITTKLSYQTDSLYFLQIELNEKFYRCLKYSLFFLSMWWNIFSQVVLLVTKLNK